MVLSALVGDVEIIVGFLVTSINMTYRLLDYFIFTRPAKSRLKGTSTREPIEELAAAGRLHWDCILFYRAKNAVKLFGTFSTLPGLLLQGTSMRG